MKRRLTWRKRHWFDRGEGHSPRFYRNEPIITDVEVAPRVYFILFPLPVWPWLRREWDHVIRVGHIDADRVGIRDVVWPESSGRLHPTLQRAIDKTLKEKDHEGPLH